MKKHVTKIICAGIAAVVATSIVAASGCSPYNKGVSLKYTHSDAEVQSNGGFAVEKDGYIYFINGIENNEANNDYGTPVKGSIMRISVDALNSGKYNSAETLVPQIAYSTSTNYEAGIFVYGDYIYYGTPSTKRNSDGIIQSEKLEMKRTKLDGSESMKDAYVTFPSADYDYRFVEENGVVYLLYVATSEKLYDESTGVNNLHSYNTKTGKDTLLAYNISNYMFDAEDKSNPRVYYTMSVYDYSGTASNKTYGYNQVYTVTAAETEPNEYDLESIIGWEKDNDHYVNCGDLVFDGIGGNGSDSTPTPFNFAPDGSEKNKFSLNYTLRDYANHTLFFTRVEHIDKNNKLGEKHLYMQKDAGLAEDWNPVTANDDAVLLLKDYSSSTSYKYIFNDDGTELTYVLVAEGSKGVVVKEYNEGAFSEDVIAVRDGTVTILFVDGDYLYYSRSDTFYRINYTGKMGNYEGMPEDEDITTDYNPVQILGLGASAASGWYKPELIGDYILFASEMESNYVIAFDLKLADFNEDGKVQNDEIKRLNKLYDGIMNDEDSIISGYTDIDDYPTDLYANLANASKYLFYTGNIDYVTKLAKACNAKLESGDDPVYSENTLNKLKDFLAAEGDWEAYHEYSRDVNGKEIYANRRDYYYSTIGKMTSSDSKSYADDFKSDYLKDWPEEEAEPTWFEGLSKTARVFFIIGMCLVGILVITIISAVTICVIRKVRGNKLPRYTKRRIKVDTTDDKNINVYEDESAESKEENQQDSEE